MKKRKIAAHDRWVCFRCRFTAKIMLLDVRTPNRPSYACPTCRRKMVWTGTAFRPPRKDDDEAWQVAERLMAAGVKFRSTRARQRLPKTLRELKEWTAHQAAGDAWLPERKLSIARRTSGAVAVRSGRRTLVDDEHVLVYHRGRWKCARMRLHGSGSVAILCSTRTVVAITAETRLRPRGDGARR